MYQCQHITVSLNGQQLLASFTYSVAVFSAWQGNKPCETKLFLHTAIGLRESILVLCREHFVDFWFETSIGLKFVFVALTKDSLHAVCGQCFIIHSLSTVGCVSVAPKGRPEISDNFYLPPVENLRAFSLILLFYIYISSLVLLSSSVDLSVLSFSAFGPFSWLLVSWT